MTDAVNVHPAWVRSGAAAALGLIAAAVVWAPAGAAFAVAVGWIVLTLIYVLWTGLATHRFTPEQTRTHALTEDASSGTVAVILTLAAVASILGVGILLAGARAQGPVPVEAILGVAVVACSWALVHTVYAVHYARLYYLQAGDAIDFNGDQPDYHDFAYLAFTIGMTYQVSDTNLNARVIRRAALHHALLSYLLGAVVLACTINLVVQLASQG